MNREQKIMARVRDHYNEALEHFEESHIVGIWLQGSQNYGLDTPNSDVDTKLIVTPSFKDIALAAKPVSTTHIRENNEHIDFKDIRLYIETFRKQNLNFLEILFTPYFIINPLYEKEWNKLVIHREEIARMNPYRAVKSMKGVGLEKYFAMEHRYPSKADIIDLYGYDGKQTSHQIRVYDYLRRYIAGENYESCLRPTEELIPRITDYKLLNKIPLEEARLEAKRYLEMTEQIADKFCAEHEDKEDPAMRELLEDVSYGIMKISVEKELSV
jgi:predicted nucleotidyltransferase